ncbi:MAG: TraR/DksA family transcriptional regulator [Desulfovibrionaceae bacterium]
MTEQDKQMIRRILETEAEALRVAEVRARLEACPDEADYASQLTQHHLDLALAGRRQRRLAVLERALERLDSPWFGVCEECGGGIGARRLAADPAAACCVDCQQERDRALGACA